MVAGVEDDGVLGTLEGPGGINPRERCRDLASELPEVAVRAGGLSPAKDASGFARHLAAPGSFVGEAVVYRLGGIGLGVLLVVVVVVPALPFAAAAGSAVAAATSALCLARFAT